MSNPAIIKDPLKATMADLIYNEKAALSNPDFKTRLDQSIDTGPGWCMKVQRKVVQTTFGSIFDKFVVAPSDKQATAIHAAKRALGLHLGFYSNELSHFGGLKPGDLLFKTTGSGGFGHVGMYLDPQHVGENSSTKLGRLPHRGALGYRTLEEFGHFDVVVRLTLGFPISQPDPTPAPPSPKLVIITTNPDKSQTRTLIQSSTLTNGQFTAKAGELHSALLHLNSPDEVVSVRATLQALGIKPYDEKNFLKEQGRYELYI